MGPFPDTKWVVCHGPDVVHYVVLPAGGVLETGQPTVESFDTEDEAEARAVALGFVLTAPIGKPDGSPADWRPRVNYKIGDRVSHQGRRWVATSDNQGNEPDDVPGDWDVCTDPLPTPPAA